MGWEGNGWGRRGGGVTKAKEMRSNMTVMRTYGNYTGQRSR
jgi:hypothetical protein